MNRRNELVLVIAITLIGAALRLTLIGAQSLWFDELMSVAISRLDLRAVLTSPASIDPPLYYILLHFWSRLTLDDGGLRVFSALAGIATIPAFYLLTRRLLNVASGMVAAGMFAIAPLQIYFAQEVRMYALLAFLATLAIWTYSRAQDLNRRRDWAVWIGVMTLALYTHNFAGLLLIAFAIDALLRWRAKTGDFKRATVSSVIIGGLFLPWFLVLLQKLTWLFPALWLKPPTILHPFLTLHNFTFGYTLALPGVVVGMIVLVAMLFFLAGSLWRVFRQGNTPTRLSLQLLGLVLTVPLIVTLLVSQWKPVYMDRLLNEASPAFYALIGWGIAASDRRAILRVGGSVALVLMIVANIAYFTQSENARPPVRDAIAYVAARTAPDELVVHTSDSTFLGGRFYDARGKHILLYHPADQWLIPSLMAELRVPYETDAARLIAGQPSFWLIVALDHIEDEQRAEKALFDRLATPVEQMEIDGISIFRYTMPR